MKYKQDGIDEKSDEKNSQYVEGVTLQDWIWTIFAYLGDATINSLVNKACGKERDWSLCPEESEQVRSWA